MKSQMTALLETYRERLQGTDPNFSGTALQQARWHWEAAKHHLKYASPVVCAYHVGFMEKLLVEAKALGNRELRKNLGLWLDAARVGIQEMIEVHYTFCFGCAGCRATMLSFERPGRMQCQLARHGNVVYMKDMMTDERLLKHGILPTLVIDGIVWLEEEQRTVVSCAGMLVCVKHTELERMAFTAARLKEIGWSLDAERKDWEKAWKRHACPQQGGPLDEDDDDEEEAEAN